MRFLPQPPEGAHGISLPQVGRSLRVGGWVKTGRVAGGGAFAFLELNDGSTFPNLQVGWLTIWQ